MLILIALFSGVVLADGGGGRFAPRIREHFESHTYRVDGQTAKFRGLSNTFNLWYEKPFHYSFGLALGPVLGIARSQDAVPGTLGTRVRLWTAGLEGKYFPMGPDLKGFARVGVAWQALDTNGTAGNISGWGGYLGLGWEFPIWRVSIAPEIAIREVRFERGVSGTVFTPCIGVHFYPELAR
jgi:hypothetical protein